MKRLKQPTPARNDPNISWKQESFSSGQYHDPSIPASKIPANAVVHAYNVLLYPEHAEVRAGMELFSTLEQPALEGRENYEATKSGNVITKTVGDDFTVQDIDNYYVWPASGRRDLIVEFISANSVRVKYSDVEQATTASNPGKVVGPENAVRFWHDSSQKLFAFFDQRVFWTDWQMTAWRQVYLHSANNITDGMVSTFSNFDAWKNMVYLFNANGVFAIDTIQDPLEMWKCNTALPDNTITEVEASETYIHGRRYTYSCARIAGAGNRSRADGARIQQETGTCPTDPDNNNKDYAEVWREYLASSNNQCEQLVCGPTGSTFAEWQSRADHWGFELSMNGSPKRMVSGSKVHIAAASSWEEIAEQIQDRLRVFFPADAPNATCEWVSDHFVFTAGKSIGTTISYLENPGAFPGIADSDWLNGEDPAVGGNGLISTRTLMADAIGPLTLPAGAQHFTHYSVYTVEDLALEGTNKEAYVWAFDLPVCKAFDAFRDNADGHIHISPGGNGEFEPTDSGTPIEFSDGTTDTLGRWISSTEMEGTSTLVAVAGQGAAIGGGRVFTASQTGTTITRTTGDNFYPADAGKTFHWADGYRSYITEWVDNNNVRTQSSASHPPQGGTMDPISRYFTDTITDETIIDKRKTYALEHRIWEPFDTMDMGAIVPGFMIVASYEGYELQYCQIGIYKEYLAGFHNKYYQTSPLKDAVTSLQEFPDRLIIFCSSSTLWAPTNVSQTIPVGDTGLFVTTLAYVDVADKVIGVKDPSSIVTLPDGIQIVITNEPGVRIFDGIRYGPNLALDPEGRSYVLADLQKLQSAVAAGYEPQLGYLIFGTEDYPDN